MNSPSELEKNGLPLPRRIAFIVIILLGVVLGLVAWSIARHNGVQIRGAENKIDFKMADSTARDLLRDAENSRPVMPEEPAIEDIPVDVTPVVTPLPKEQVRYLVPKSNLKLITQYRRSRAQQIQALALTPSVVTMPEGAAQGKGQQGVTGGVDGDNALLQQLAAQGGAGNGQGGHDANGWAMKDAFLRQNLPTNTYSQFFQQEVLSPFELKAGTLIPAVLVSGLNSDLPGDLLAHVSEDVYDTVAGVYLLIPKGSKLLGVYDNKITEGQRRVMAVWQRLIFPDGSSITLNNLKGTDAGGYSGFKGAVNRHFNSLVTNALAISLLAVAVDGITPPQVKAQEKAAIGSQKEQEPTTLSGQMAKNVSQALGEKLKGQAGRQATIKVKSGYRFQIFIKEDLLLKPWNIQ